MKLQLAKQTLEIIKDYQDKDYFHDNSLVSNKIRERDRAIERGQEDARKFTDEIIEKHIKTHTRKTAFYGALKLYNGIKQQDKDYLLSRVRYDQNMTKKLFSLYTGIKLPRTNKEIRKVIQEL